VDTRNEGEIFEDHSDWCGQKVKYWMKAHRWKTQFYEELQAAGLRGLFAAIQKWDRRRRFRTYAYHIIKSHCMDWLRYQDYKQKNSVKYHTESWDSEIIDETFTTERKAVLKPREHTPDEIIAEIQTWRCSQQIKDSLIDLLVVDRCQCMHAIFVRHKGQIKSLYSLITKGMVDKTSEIVFVRGVHKPRDASRRQRGKNEMQAL